MAWLQSTKKVLLKKLWHSEEICHVFDVSKSKEVFIVIAVSFLFPFTSSIPSNYRDTYVQNQSTLREKIPSVRGVSKNLIEELSVMLSITQVCILSDLRYFSMYYTYKYIIIYTYMLYTIHLHIFFIIFLSPERFLLV